MFFCFSHFLCFAGEVEVPLAGTKLYGGLRSHNVKDGSGSKTADTRLFALGLRHDF